MGQKLYKISGLGKWMRAIYPDMIWNVSDLPDKKSVSTKEYKNLKQGFEAGCIGLQFGIMSPEYLTISPGNTSISILQSSNVSGTGSFPCAYVITKNQVAWRLCGYIDENQVSHGPFHMDYELYENMLTKKGTPYLDNDFYIAAPLRFFDIKSKRQAGNELDSIYIDKNGVDKVLEYTELWKSLSKKEGALVYDAQRKELDDMELYTYSSSSFKASVSNKTNFLFVIEALTDLTALEDFINQAQYYKYNQFETPNANIDDVRIAMQYDATKTKFNLIPVRSSSEKNADPESKEMIGAFISDITLPMETFAPYDGENIRLLSINFNKNFDDKGVNITCLNQDLIGRWIKMLHSMYSKEQFEELKVMIRVPESFNISIHMMALLPIIHPNATHRIVSDMVYSNKWINAKSYSASTDTFIIS
jgi:hypothetical protein